MLKCQKEDLKFKIMYASSPVLNILYAVTCMYCQVDAEMYLFIRNVAMASLLY